MWIQINEAGKCIAEVDVEVEESFCEKRVLTLGFLPAARIREDTGQPGASLHRLASAGEQLAKRCLCVHIPLHRTLTGHIYEDPGNLLPGWVTPIGPSMPPSFLL